MAEPTYGTAILMIAPTPFFADRGCHVRILEEVKSLTVLGYRVMICTYHIGRDIKGIEIRRIIRIPWYSKLSAGPSIHKFYLDLLLLFTVVRACLKRKPDIIHAHLHEGVAIGKIASFLFHIPFVGDLQGSLTAELSQHDFIKPRGFIHLMFRWGENIINRMPDFILTSSPGALPHTNSEGLMQKTTMIADGVDTDRFSPHFALSELRQELGISETAKIVGFLGVLTDYQGVSVLLDAIPHVVKGMKGVHFLIMGYPNVRKFQQKAETLGIAKYVTFTGRVPYEETPKYLSLCDVAVSPKFVSTEANGKLLNYMALGLPIVASDTPVNRHILGDLGIYARVRSSMSLARAILKVLSNEQLALRLATQLRKKAEDVYSWKSAGKRIARIYQDLMTRNH